MSPQVIGGSSEQNETPEGAVKREVFEESGPILDSLYLIGQFGFYKSETDENQIRHVIGFDTQIDRESCVHEVSAGAEDKNLKFSFHWISIEEASSKLFVEMGLYLKDFN